MLRHILTKPIKRRSDEELSDALIPMMRDIQFFKERGDVKEADFAEIGQCLTYEYFKNGNSVFEWGSVGDKFYIILQGVVSVQVPNEQYKKTINEMMKEEVMK
jgi:signal-transduction protein with cAMP-binding, CBS, and nucleotidyltransferase domain